MKVLLLRPNSRMVMAPMPLGLGYVAQALRERRGDDVEILDGRNLRLSMAQIAERLRRARPDVVGITATIMDSREIHEVARIARRELPGAKVIVGGPYVSSSPDAAMKNESIDVAVLGEGESTAVELLDAFEKGAEDLGGIDGIVFRKEGETITTPKRKPAENLDDVRPAWDLLKPHDYFGRLKQNSHNRIRKDQRVVAIFTSRGCPYNCIFCHNVFGKKIRYMSAEAVIDEIEMLVARYGIRELEFVDDCFNHNLDRAKAIFREIIRRRFRLHITFPNGLRGDRMDEELLDLFKEAGVFRVSYAIEAASPRVQKLIKKNLDLDKVKAAITATAKRGIFTVGFFIMGFPTETADEMRMTVDFALASDVHIANFFYLAPYPGTEVARMAALDGHNVDFSDFSDISVNLSAATDAELHDMAKRAYRRFYLNPLRVARILKVVPKNTHLLLNAFITARLLFQDAVAR
jgi:anaerobic magnesium-protoporphyrin IX monomethyl ester cyclase